MARSMRLSPTANWASDIRWRHGRQAYEARLRPHHSLYALHPPTTLRPDLPGPAVKLLLEINKAARALGESGGPFFLESQDCVARGGSGRRNLHQLCLDSFL